MKTILVDAVHAFIIENIGVYQPMLELLEEYPNPKIVITGSKKEDFEKRGLSKSPYEVFTLEGNPKKSDPEYYQKLLDYYHLSKDDVLLFEHNSDAVRAAQSSGIKTYFYDQALKDLRALKEFLDSSL